MATSLASVPRLPDSVSGAIAAALKTTALGRFPAEERAWAARIEARRRDLPAMLAAAGSPERPQSERLSEAARAAAWMSVPPVWGRFLMRLVRELAPRSCIELGTGFGISTAYQAAALELNGDGRIVSLDLDALTSVAHPGLASLELRHRVELVGGRIEDTLPGVLEGTGPIEYALLDSDHTEQGTLSAFDALAPHMRSGAIVVLDDINWTDGMRRAWSSVARRERVAATVGLRRVGIAVVSSDGS